MSIAWASTVHPHLSSFNGFREGANNTNPFGPQQGIKNAAYCCSFACIETYNVGVRWHGRQFREKGNAYCPFQVADHPNLVRFDHASKGDPADLLPGDQVFFSWNNNGVADHIETVVAVYADGTYDTIGANTGSPNGVWEPVRRDRKYLLARLRPGYAEAPIAGGVAGDPATVPAPTPVPPTPRPPATALPPNTRFQWDDHGHHVGAQVWHAGENRWWTQDAHATEGVWEVRAIQLAVTRAGQSCGPDPSPALDKWCDGIGGPNTLRAVQRFQKSVGLTDDGYVGPVTRSKLFA